MAITAINPGWAAQMVLLVPFVDTTLPPVSLDPWGPAGYPTITARELIDQARIRDARFFDLKIPDGALLSYLNTKQRTLLLQLADAIQPFIDESRQVLTTVRDAVVGIDPTDGVTPYYLTTRGAGYSIQIDPADGVTPYFDQTSLPLSLDPFGANGGPPGILLPVDTIKVVMAVASFSDGTTCDIEIIPERNRHQGPTHQISCFVSGNRMVPMRCGSSRWSGGQGQTGDWWSSCTAVAVTWVGMQSVSSLITRITIPTVMHEAIIAGLCSILAQGVVSMSPNEKAQWSVKSANADAALLSIGRDMAGQITQSTVIYNG